MKKKELIDFICLHCKNFDTLRIGGCKAFPGQIPDIILTGHSAHFHHIKGQIGNYIFTPVEEPMKIWRQIDKSRQTYNRSEKKLRIEKWL